MPHSSRFVKKNMPINYSQLKDFLLNKLRKMSPKNRLDGLGQIIHPTPMLRAASVGLN